MQKEVLAGFRQVRSVPILDRIGHKLCSMALWPTIQRAVIGFSDRLYRADTTAACCELPKTICETA